MEKSLLELCESFLKGLISRRDFAKKILLTTGGLAAVDQLAGLTEQAHAAPQGEIVTEEGTYPSGKDEITYFLAKPSQGGPFPTMIVIHEIYGLSDFIREVARLFARTGYLAMAPCLPEGGCQLLDGKHSQWMIETLKTGIAAPDADEITKLIDGNTFLTGREDVDTDHIGSVGFCWGGARSFTLATRLKELWVAVVFYGSTPPFEDLANIQAPVLGLYGGLDNGSATSITGRAAETAREMSRRGKVFEWEVYNMAPHAFFRGDSPPGTVISTSRAAVIAWDLVQDFLNRNM
jgi:carboxymethylenebutenolidase